MDILIEGHRLEAVHATLLQQGFAYVPKPEGRPVSQTLNYERSYQSPSGLLVDVHRAFSDNERAEVDWEGVWARSLVMEEGPLQGMARLSPEDFLLSLVVHVGQDNFQGPLRQWFDLASWISECEIDWNAVKIRARSWNVTRLLAAVVTRLQVMGLRNEGMEMAFAEELQEASRYLGWWMKRDRVTPLSHGTPFRFGQLFLAIPLLDSHEKRLQWGRRYLKVRTQDWLASKKGSGKEN